LYRVNKVGSIYLTSQNEIGIFIKKSFQNKQIGNIALRKLIKKNPKKRYLANVNPKNKKSIRFFKNNGFKLIQYTFELNKIKN
jgi:RimJ/RimL family protein N-acetyltransferase